ncbi:MAG: DUF1329 domain-containing protein [Lysobacterales bacterium]
MQIRKQMMIAALVAMAAGSGASLAGVSPEQAARLGNDLTPVGAIKAGNSDGTIPEWTGGITRPPEGYKAGEFHRDPFRGDKPLFAITPQNYKDYQAKLNVGQVAMFDKYKDFKMIVYPTRRSGSFPQIVYDTSKKNAVTAKLVSDGDGVAGASIGFPFPIPQNGYELIWNHKLKYKSTGGMRWANQAAPTASGAYTLVRLREEFLGPYYKPGNTIENINDVLLYFFQEVVSPARLAGNVLLVHETVNQTKTPRQAWVYNPGQRRVRRAPNIAYDNPGTASDGLRTNDMTDMFNGAMDRFEFKLAGTREMFIPYNDYLVHSGTVKLKDLVKPGHLNPNYIRYELHRVWVVEATLKPGKRHINKRRTFYLDEDSYQIVAIDHYDSRGQLWRYSEAPNINYYEVPTVWATVETHHDLQSGRYISGLLDNEESTPVNFGFQTTPENFSPQSLRKRGIR